MSVILLCYVVLSGVVMAVRIFYGARPPVLLAVGHGVMAAMAIVLVALAARAAGAGLLLAYAAAVLSLTALSGFYLLSFHVRERSHPKTVVTLHALLAAAGLALLLLSWF